MARHEARVEHAPDMRSPGLFKSNAPQGIGGSGRLYVSSGCRYRRVSLHQHYRIRAQRASLAIIAIHSYVQLPSKEDGTGTNGGVGLLLYSTVMASSGLPGRISKRSRSPENVPCLVAGAKRKILDLIIEWHSPFGRRALACFV